MKTQPRALPTHARPACKPNVRRIALREALHQQKGLLMGLVVRTLAEPVLDLADQCLTDKGTVARWCNRDCVAAPTLVNLMVGTDRFVDLVITKLAEIRARNGHGKRRWVIVDDDERHPDREQRAVQMAAAIADVDVANARVRELAKLMSGGQ